MTQNLPNYATTEPPEGKPVEEYRTHERRAEILQRLTNAGSPSALKQVRLAERYDVAESTISRDMDRLRESVAGHLGDEAKLTTQTLFEKTVRELHREGEWKAAWDVTMDWNDWLADLGEQHREPRRSELGVDMRAHHSEVTYEIVREGDEEPLPTDGDDAGVDHEDLGFTSAPPVEIDLDHEGGDEL